MDYTNVDNKLVISRVESESFSMEELNARKVAIENNIASIQSSYEAGLAEAQAELSSINERISQATLLGVTEAVAEPIVEEPVE